MHCNMKSICCYHNEKPSVSLKYLKRTRKSAFVPPLVNMAIKEKKPFDLINDLYKMNQGHWFNVRSIVIARGDSCHCHTGCQT